MNISNNDPLVSIVCTTYNHEKYIKEALDSFLMQKTNFPYEIIIHDDASTDSTPLIVKEYEQKHSDLFHNIYQSENQYSKDIDIWSYLFINECRGKYIAICEGDDFWIDSLKLQKQVDFLENNLNYSMCFHNAMKLYNETGLQELFNKVSIKSRELSLHDVVHHWLVPTASILGRTDFMKFYPDWWRHIYSSDYSLILKMYIKGPIFYLDEVMSIYRISHVGTSMTVQMRNRNAFMLEQKILFLESFNKGTNREYHIEIDKRIAVLKKELIFQKAKEKNKCFLLIKMPFFLVKKIIKKIAHL